MHNVQLLQQHRIPTPPTVYPISWPGVVPSRDLSNASSIGFRPRLTEPLQESLAWENSTHFRSTSEGSNQELLAFAAEVNDARSSRTSKQYHRNPRHLREAWRAGGWRRVPWRGMGSLVNGTSVPSWTITPHVYLAVFEMLVCLLTLCALCEGVVVAFWRLLLHGTTIADVFDTFESTSFWPAAKLLIRGHFNGVALATVLSVLSLARYPLLQRSIITSDSTYTTHTAFVIIGMLIQFASIAAIVILYYGYWELGRQVSLDPLEIARAFGAPLFDGLDGNMSASDLAMQRGHVAIRYGAVERYGGEKVLRIDDASRVNMRLPWEGEVFG
ncbi:hypothetical protein EK21DRAFT_69024 [Setomelanomma holmii]|uniref:Uncharacterized protein n=1 Tax=Setomelanomma holmii TaxID=210430 RepID=A0A9P4LKK5_9PLEO|nr:hypothetical protein EK21DRAFT_69024 [Setomelanomma holmii]